MAFYKTASVPIIGVLQYSGKHFKVSAQKDNFTDEDTALVQRSINLISKPMLNAIARIYNISDDVNDYIFPIPRAVTADIPNDNGDNFTHEELSRFSSGHKCLVYQTFNNSPLHVEHMAFDPKAARGFLPDSHYAVSDPKDKHVLVVAAIDATKDSQMAQNILSGESKDFSMGCICEKVRCRACGKISESDDDLCTCLRYHKGTHVNGSFISEDCLGVEFQELSKVGVGADPRAKTKAILQFQASKQLAAQRHQEFLPISNVLPSATDQREVARYLQENLATLPASMVKLADRLF